MPGSDTDPVAFEHDLTGVFKTAFHYPWSTRRIAAPFLSMRPNGESVTPDVDSSCSSDVDY